MKTIRHHTPNELGVFVYGTLMPGHANHALITHLVASTSPAKLLAHTLYDLGPFPCIVKSYEGGVVPGWHLTFTDHDAALALMDNLEGFYGPDHEHNMYNRTTGVVIIPNPGGTDTSTRAHTYTWARHIRPEATRVPSGTGWRQEAPT